MTIKFASSLLDHVLEHGYATLKQVISQLDCQQVLKYIKSTRNFGRNLFLDEPDFRINPQYKGVNPVVGRNILENIDLSCIEKNKMLHSLLTNLLGENYYMVIKKAIYGVPKEWIPDWVISEINNVLVANLGCFIKPKYRDITYFRGIDFHQDIIDYKNRISDFITLYLYLDEVSAVDSPLVAPPGSHIFGATTFPHHLVNSNDVPASWLYSDRCGNHKPLQSHILNGFAGDISLWHPCFLHGTQPIVVSHSRISLWYIIAKSVTDSTTFLDYINAKIKRPLSLDSTRVDLNHNGRTLITGNIINGKV